MEDVVVQRIRLFLKNKRISNRMLSNMISVSETTLNNKLNGIRSLDLNTLKGILTRFEELSTEWLLRGEGEMLKDKGVASISRQDVPIPTSEESFIYKIYQEEKEENKTLIKQNAVLEERIRQLEADNESLRNQAGADKITDTFTDIPLDDYEEDYIPVKRPSDSKRPSAGKV